MYYSNRHYQNLCDCRCNDGGNFPQGNRRTPQCPPAPPCGGRKPVCSLHVCFEPCSCNPPQIRFEIRI